MIQATVTSRTIAVEHIKISSKHSFEEVRQKLEGTLPKFDRNIAAALSNEGGGFRAAAPLKTVPIGPRLKQMWR